MFKRLKDGWLELAHYIGEFQARLLLTTVYFVCLGPFSLMAGSGDPLGLKGYTAPPGSSGWLKRRPADATLEQAAGQF